MKKIKALVSKNPLLSGSFIMLIGSNIANIFAYIYHPIFGRILGKDSYGELAAFLSLLGFLASFYSFLGLLITKYASKHKTKSESLNHFFAFLDYFNKPVVVISLIILITTPIFASLLKISLLNYALISPVFYISFVIFFYKSYLQGRLSFTRISIYTVYEVMGRLLFGVLLFYMGFGVTGAVLGLLITILIELSILRRDIRRPKAELKPLNTSSFVRDGLPVLITTFATTAFFSMDVLLVRRFFGNSEAGSFAAASVLGKIILFATAPITAVLFPLISKKHAGGETGSSVFLTSFVITLLLGGCFTLLFYFFPSIVVLPFGSQFSTSIPLLFPYSTFIYLLVLSLVIVNYYLPREKYFTIKCLGAAAFLQSVGIIMFHQSLISIIYVSIAVTFTLLLVLLIYFVHEDEQIRKILSNAFGSNPRI